MFRKDEYIVYSRCSYTRDQIILSSTTKSESIPRELGKLESGSSFQIQPLRKARKAESVL